MICALNVYMYHIFYLCRYMQFSFKSKFSSSHLYLMGSLVENSMRDKSEENKNQEGKKKRGLWLHVVLGTDWH